MDNQNKNLILASVLSFIVIFVWFLLFPPPAPVTDTNTTVQTAESVSQDGMAVVPPVIDQATGNGATPTPAQAPAAEIARVSVETPALTGSISLKGGRIDTLALVEYDETLKPDSGKVKLLSPFGSEKAYYAVYGWTPAGNLQVQDVPDANTIWQLESGDKLTPNTPITLAWDNGKGLVFKRQISIDDHYLFSIQQSVQNNGAEEVRLAPYGIVARHGTPDTVNFFVLHEGVVRQSDKTLEEIEYKKMPDMDFLEREGARAEIADVQENGWIGFTDKYWMTSLIPSPGQSFTSVAKYVASADIYQIESRLPTVSVAPGSKVTKDTMLFAGAKEWETIREYQNENGIHKFLDSIDWGWFFFLTKPIFAGLHMLNGLIGNMGWSIIALTFAIKAILFPLAYKSYVAMARMKELQPRIAELKERAGDDRAKLQQEMMALYKKEKVNPAAGCMPLLLQIPIFFSLYKVIFVTIELRHAPWLGWIRDLSAPDPSSILNLFGLLSFSPPEPGTLLAFISLGILPILLGISMWLQQKLNPAPTDPAQAMVFAWMPWVFMFMLGSFASGLVLYWITNNTITFTQQYIIMRSHGHKPDVFGRILESFKRKKPEAK